MRLLLDTHALIWALSAPAKLPPAVATKVRASDSEVFASAASTWEIAIKAALGKIDVDLEELIEGIKETRFTELPVTLKHTARVRTLEPHHRDPFDRLLIAQAFEEGLTVVTRDPAFEPYAVALLWK